jgi:HPt (histidine-containing phosphotransfer) domain-containing protein
MDDYVAKPIRPHELAKALGRARPLAEPDLGGATGARVNLDAAAVASLRELGGDGFVAEVVETFLDDAPALLATLRTSLEAGDTEELRRAAHTLKSNGQTFGAARFSELCRELEERARRGDLDGASELVDRIAREYDALGAVLAELRPQPA